MTLSKHFLIIVLAYLITIVLAQTTSNDTETKGASTSATATATATTNTTITTTTTTISITTTGNALTSSNSISSTLLPSSTSSSLFLELYSITPTYIPSSIPSTTSTNAYAIPSVQSTGWDANENHKPPNEQSWLKQNNRFVFVIFIGLFVVGVLIWYIVRSIKGMRKRLAQENEAHLYMMQQASTPRTDRVIPELTQTPPPAYKPEENRAVYQPGHGQ